MGDKSPKAKERQQKQDATLKQGAKTQKDAAFAKAHPANVPGQKGGKK